MSFIEIVDYNCQLSDQQIPRQLPILLSDVPSTLKDVTKLVPYTKHVWREHVVRVPIGGGGESGGIGTNSPPFPADLVCR